MRFLAPMSVLDPSVPVRMEESWGGLANNTGLLRLEGDTVVIEFETRDGMFDVLRSGVKRIDVQLADLESVRWKRGVFGGKIEFAARSMDVLAEIPGATQGRVTLSVARKDRDQAFGLVTNMELVLAHRFVRAVEAASDPERKR